VIVASTGEQLGVMKIQDALRAAQQLGLDLVEVAPQAQPPVCRIVDFGKFKYEQAKHDKDKKHTTAGKVKEIKFRVNIGAHDYETKLRHAEEFLDKGNKVRVLLQFRGREMAHKELGVALLGRVRDDLSTMGIVEMPPKAMGKSVIMTLTPLPPAKRKRQFAPSDDLPPLEDDADEEDDDETEEEDAK
jgi:translation initiation factor IF-3